MRLVRVSWLPEGSTYPIETVGWLAEEDAEELRVAPHRRADTEHAITDGPYAYTAIPVSRVKRVMSLEC